MSEFKFACPVCGQHITADSGNAGSHLECPTCFRKIVVPQAPATADPKFILAAAEVGKPRPRTSTPGLDPVRKRPAKTKAPTIAGIILVALCVAGAAVYGFRQKLFGTKDRSTTPDQTDPAEEQRNEAGAAVIHAASNNVAWKFDLAGTTIPDSPPAGKIRGEYVFCNRVTLTGGALGLRQTTRGAPDLSVTVYFFARQAEDLRGKQINVVTNDLRAPRVVVRWKEGKETKSQTFRNGYALKAELGDISGNHIPGKIYLSLPDENQTRVAGTFNAEIRKPNPPKPRPQLSPPR